jgi:phosphatidylglycerophosphate synthase
MICAILAAVSFWATDRFPENDRWWWALGAALIQLRLLANMLDGMVAQESNTASAVGEIYNEVPDRISDSVILIALGYLTHPVLGYAAALVAMSTAYVRAVGKVAGAPQDFSGPLAKPQRMFLCTLLALWFAVAREEWRSVGKFSLVTILLWIIIAGSAITALRRLGRIIARLKE